MDLALDNAGNLYFAGTGDQPGAQDQPEQHDRFSRGLAAGSAGYSGDGVAPRRWPSFLGPSGVAVDAQGDVFFIADTGNSVVRMISGATIWTVAGTGAYAFDLESGPARGVSIDPVGISVDSSGASYIADEFNDRIRKLTPVIPAGVNASSKNVQTAVPGTQFSISVTVTDASGSPVGGAIVNFSVTVGSAQLSASAVETNASGVATVLGHRGLRRAIFRFKPAWEPCSPLRTRSPPRVLKSSPGPATSRAPH